MVKNYISWCIDILIVIVGLLIVISTAGLGVGFVATSRVFAAVPLAFLTGFVGIAAGILVAIIGFKRINNRF